MAVATSGDHTLALKEDGTLFAWGANSFGQIGDGTTTDRNTPVQVRAPGGIGVLSGVMAIAAGRYHSLALTTDGAVLAWGLNASGQIGDGTTTDRNVPVEVVGPGGGGTLSGVAAIAAGAGHSAAARSDGTAWAWGSNQRGQLGDGTDTERHWPVQVLGPPGTGFLGNVVAVAAGGAHTLARQSDDSLWAWGGNAFGELGIGDEADRWTPGPVVAIAALRAGKPSAGGSMSLVTTRDNMPPVGDPQSVSAAACVPKAITLTGSDGDGDPLTYAIVAPPSHGSLTGSPPDIAYTSDPGFAGSDNFTFKVNDGRTDSEPAGVAVSVAKAATTLYVTDRTGTITEAVQLRQYDLKRTTDNATLEGKTIRFKVDETDVGSAVTDAGGDSALTWVIADGPASRTITAEFAGDAAYLPSSDNATLTCQSWSTKMATFNRTARITDRTELKCRLLRSDNVPLYNKTINFYVDGTFIITRPTNVDGYAGYPNYVVPDGAGAGTRTILSEWVGNGGYAAISKTATLTVNRAIPYIWVLPKTIPQGAIANLYAYFRRLYDYQKQAAKTVDFKIDGTVVQTVVTDTNGVARYLYRTTEPPGVYTIRCEFYGDAWLDPGCGEGNLTIY